MTTVNENEMNEIQQALQEMPETPAPKAKQYLIMADEIHMAMLGKMMPGLLFVQVEGLAMQGNSDHMLLVNPVQKVPTVTAPIEGVKAENVLS